LKKKNRANWFTFLRILGVMVLWSFLVPFQTFSHQVWAIRLFVILVATDALDGWIARSRLGQPTKLGKMLDPVADKLLYLVLLPLISMGAVSYFPVIILMARDILVDGLLRTSAAIKGKVIAARRTGKIKTDVAFFLAGVSLCRVPVSDMPASGFDMEFISWFQRWPDWLMFDLNCSLAIIALISLVDYFFFNRQVLLED